MQRRQGFTLIELLVVIAIIAILAAILFPVFARAREKARQTSCLSNQKQIGLALMMYVQDYDETYPAYYNFGSTVPAGARYWNDVIQPYTKNWQMFICPSQSTTSYYASYAANYYFVFSNFEHDSSWPPEHGDKLSEIKRPAEIIAVAEGTSYITIYDPGVASSSGGYWGLIDARHNEGLNIAFCDGHAKWMKRDVVAPSSSRNQYWDSAYE